MVTLTNMSVSDAIALYRQINDLNIEIWIDGGWSVDALLGEQTRPHNDLDIVIQQRDVPKLRVFLESRGFQVVERDDTSAWNFVLGDSAGREVDVHAIVLDDAGNGLYGPAERGVMYPAGALAGTGLIGEHPVKCIAPEYLVAFHSGYKLQASDIHDVSALCERFAIPLPDEYRSLINPQSIADDP
jgi:lincosamide nucleotidyltransferase A/C/D/E